MKKCDIMKTQTEDAVFQCTQCGHCCSPECMGMWFSVDTEDLERWRNAERSDILAKLRPDKYSKNPDALEGWVNEDDGEYVDTCPWLYVYGCMLHADGMKPRHCRNFPRDEKDADTLGCPGYKGFKP